MSRYLTPARDAILQRRYGAKGQKPRLIAIVWPREVGGALQVLQGHACQSKTKHGVMFNRRIRLVRRLDLSSFKRSTYCPLPVNPH